jgi:hypothetical protein
MDDSSKKAGKQNDVYSFWFLERPIWVVHRGIQGSELNLGLRVVFKPHKAEGWHVYVPRSKQISAETKLMLR